MKKPISTIVPPSRFCFSCGGSLQKRFVPVERCWRHVCSRCGQITYLNPKVVAGLIPVTKSGKIVLLQRDTEPGKGKWSYPAGYVESGETVEGAARRETREEIKTRVKVGRLVGVYSYKKSGIATVVYQGKVLKGERPRPGDEAAQVREFDPGKIPWKRLAFKSTVQALKDWLECPA